MVLGRKKQGLAGPGTATKNERNRKVFAAIKEKASKRWIKTAKRMKRSGGSRSGSLRKRGKRRHLKPFPGDREKNGAQTVQFLIRLKKIHGGWRVTSDKCQQMKDEALPSCFWGGRQRKGVLFHQLATEKEGEGPSPRPDRKGGSRRLSGPRTLGDKRHCEMLGGTRTGKRRKYMKVEG